MPRWSLCAKDTTIGDLNMLRLVPSVRRGALWLLSAVAVLGLSACDGGMRFPVSESAQEDLAARNINVIRITPENIGFYTTSAGLRLNVEGSNPPPDPQPYSYRVGNGDRLRVLTWTTPDRTREGEGTLTEGPIVDETGQFFFPFVGTTRARGLTTAQIRRNLEQELALFINQPQVEVSVEAFNAHKVTVVGQIESPGTQTLTNVPLRLFDLVNAAGPTSNADLRRVSIRRGQNTYSVNLQGFIENGMTGHNPILLPNDTVFVPPIDDNRVFVFGEIRIGELRLTTARLTLTEVLVEQGGIPRGSANARGVFVFRQTPQTPDGFDVFQFNLMDAATLMLTSQFAMAPMDVVFVTTDPITSWNRSVAKLLSPVQGIVRARSIADNLN